VDRCQKDGGKRRLRVGGAWFLDGKADFWENTFGSHKGVYKRNEAAYTYKFRQLTDRTGSAGGFLRVST
jgi:hypothetical protein